MWQALKNLKESFPVETAEYSVSHEINHQLAFNWWVREVLKKRPRIIYIVNKGNA